MSKKIKNSQHKQALKRKGNAELTLSLIDMSLDSKLLSIIIILKDLKENKINLQCFNQINKISKEFVGIDFGIISHEINNSPIITCPILNLPMIKQLTHPIISTNISTTTTALLSKSDKIYYYIFDDEFIPAKIKNNKRIKYVACNNEIFDKINKDKEIENSQMIEDFNMIEFIKLINKDLK